MAKKGKKGKQEGSRRDQREARKLEAQAQAQAQRRAAARRKALLIAIPVLALATAGAIEAAGGPRPALGAVLLLSLGAWLVVALGGLGANVKPRDRSKSGNIDYGR